MDETETSSAADSAAPATRKTRKPAAKRATTATPRARAAKASAKAEPVVDTIEVAPAAPAAPGATRTRTRSKTGKTGGKAAASEAHPELPLQGFEPVAPGTAPAPVESVPPPPAPVPAEHEPRPVFRPEPSAGKPAAGSSGTETPAASAAGRADAPASRVESDGRPGNDDAGQGSPAASAPAVPASDADHSPEPSGASTSDAAPAADAPSDSSAPSYGNGNGNGGGQSNGGGGKKIKDDRPWWERKKDKKKQKWLEKQGQRGGGGGGGDRPDRAPAQPPPPDLRPVYGELPSPNRFTDLAALDTLAAGIAAAAAAAPAPLPAAAPASGLPIALDQLYALTAKEITARATALGATFEAPPSRKLALEAFFKAAATQNLPMTDRGWLDITDKGYGFLVHEHVNYRLYPENTYVPESLVRRYGLKRGHQIQAWVTAPGEGERCPAAVGIRSVMGGSPEDVARVVAFEELIPYYPLRRILMEAPEIHKDISMRAVDLLTPIGFGQRGLIVAPPRTGKTVLLHNIANSISNNYPEAKLIILLVDERPEEVTDFKRHCKGEVVSSTFDEAPESHVHAAEMVIEKARRLVEKGGHVVILLDSITRLARAYNALASNSGKIMSGGVEATALQKPKRFFGSARNIEGGGSLTILGTALIDTGSRMDEVIFEEFKGTGNMELHLDRGLSDKRIFPAINIDRSGTRKEELIYHPDEMQRVYGLRRAMQGIPPVEAMDMFIQRLKKTRTNAEFLLNLSR